LFLRVKIFQDALSLYFVTEFIPHKLTDLVPNGKGLALELVRFFAAQLVLAIEYMHMQMLTIHRDLKPQNIMVTDEYQIKVVSRFC
jgi:serine/threonine protein kinase